MANPDDILNAREARKGTIDRLAAKGGPVVSVRANVPGTEKTNKIARYVVGRFAARFGPDAQETLWIDDADGLMFLARYAAIDASTLKALAVQAEESRPLGRLADIDVYTPEGKALTRGTLRPCLLCNEYAAVCAREGRHSVEALLQEMERITREDAATFAADLIDGAIRAELDLEPKFGLVTKSSKGSHEDMDYALMKQAKNAIVPHLAAMFTIALDDDRPAEMFARARKEGIEAERAMFSVTGGVNAYEGLIFSMGLAATAAGKAIFGGFPHESIYEFVSRMAEPLIGELDKKEVGTFGKKAWAENRIGGARLEAARGFPSVRAAVGLVGNCTRIELHRALCALIGVVEDTTLLKRAASRQRYDEIRSKFTRIDDFAREKMAALTAECIAEGLSFGGSADLLATSVFLKRIQAQFLFQPS
ncbi:MAG: triphosphoribosyl-dephospho-CoA synthase [Bacillota bacterium]|nr:triphosphoribosyl-dephospho-CoA synthase [Bacillota bacterium]